MQIPYFVQNIFLVLGGLGLFLFGMRMMMDGLERLAGNKMRTIIERATSNSFIGIAAGAVVTIIIQSSTATSVMAVGFINAGLMSLSQAISLIMGAHIGTTLSAHLFAFPGITAVAPLLIFAGIIMYLFLRKTTVKDAGFIVLGVGVLFFGLSVMSGPLRAFAQTPGFQSMLTAFENPFLAILSGFIFTAIIQSSTAATAILIALLHQGVDMDFTVAAYLVLGISAGTTITAVIASLAGRRESKRAALANLLFITIGCIVFGTVIFVFPGILLWFQNTWHESTVQLAMFYTFFKVALTVTFVPFVRHLAALMYKIMPKQGKGRDAKQLLYINTESSNTPSLAIEQASSEIGHMAQVTLGNLKRALEGFFTGDNETISAVLETESSINYLNRHITSMLMELQNVESAAEMKKLSTLLYVARDFERMGDYAKNFVEHDIRTKKKQRLRLPPAAIHELENLSEAVVQIVTMAVEVFGTRAQPLIRQIHELEDRIDDICRIYIENHVKRLKTEKSDPRGGVTFLAMINDLERCADHANNIAGYFLDKAVADA